MTCIKGNRHHAVANGIRTNPCTINANRAIVKITDFV